MNMLLLILLGVVGGLSVILGGTAAAIDISNKEVPTPKDFHECGYNWFGSWIIFLLRTFLALPYWFIGTIILLICKFIKWILTV